MPREHASAQARRLAAYTAEHCALPEQRFTTRTLGYEVRAPA